MLSFVCFFLFNQAKNKAVLEPKTGHFRVLVGFEAKTKDLKMCPRGLHLCLYYPLAQVSFLCVYFWLFSNLNLKNSKPKNRCYNNGQLTMAAKRAKEHCSIILVV